MAAAEHPSSRESAVERRSRSLLYRFFLFDWLFADVAQANGLLERRAAWRHNRQMRRYLPTYLRRWGFLALLAFLTGWLCESGLAANWLAAFWFVGFSLSLAVMAVIVVVWVFTGGIEVR